MNICVLVVDDSALMRMMITRMLETDPNIRVVDIARNGVDAVKKVQNLHPDVVTMDVEMPELDGIGALQQIMTQTPTPVIMLSTLTTKGADATLDALRFGAVDFIAKPGTRAHNITEVEKELVAKVKAAAKARVHKSGVVSIPVHTQVHYGPEENVKPYRQINQLLAIGASTGGPRALDVVLRGIPRSILCPILVVQHMPPTFTKSLADRLNSVCDIMVVEARHNQVLENGTAYIAPGGFHMTVVRRDGHYRILLNENEKRNEHRPSVDVLFESIALLQDVSRHLVLLTGMGKDGAVGMQRAKNSGAITTVEAEETCVVYGMPKSAVELGCVDHIVPLHRIGHTIIETIAELSPKNS